MPMWDIVLNRIFMSLVGFACAFSTIVFELHFLRLLVVYTYFGQFVEKWHRGPFAVLCRPSARWKESKCLAPC